MVKRRLFLKLCPFEMLFIAKFQYNINFLLHSILYQSLEWVQRSKQWHLGSTWNRGAGGRSALAVHCTTCLGQFQLSGAVPVVWGSSSCLGQFQLSGAVPVVWGSSSCLGQFQLSGAVPVVWGSSSCLGQLQFRCHSLEDSRGSSLIQSSPKRGSGSKRPT